MRGILREPIDDVSDGLGEGVVDCNLAVVPYKRAITLEQRPCIKGSGAAVEELCEAEGLRLGPTIDETV